jgi:DNA replication and repair protein RecF
MHLRSLYLQQFRNYRESYFEFHPSLNLICGPNAQGKTSLLEAIHYLMFGRSFRPGLHQDLIHMGCNSFYLEAIFSKHEVDQKLRVYVEGKERKMMHNSTPLPNVSNLLGLIQGVVMTPDDVNLVKGPPSLRRQFLDMQMAQVDPLYIHYLARYTKAMQHRNQLLKNKTVRSIESWEHEMAQASAYLIWQRRRCIQNLQIHCQKFYSYLTEERETLKLEYRSAASACQSEKEIKEFHLRQFHDNRNRELSVGYTLVGPHKDDIWIGIEGRDVRFFASEGQQRSCVAALHMGEWQCLKQAGEEIPLFMIDDVSISLDEKRRSRLLEQLSSLGQVFLTTTDVDSVNGFGGQKKIFLLPLALSLGALKS